MTRRGTEYRPFTPHSESISHSVPLQSADEGLYTPEEENLQGCAVGGVMVTLAGICGASVAIPWILQHPQEAAQVAKIIIGSVKANFAP